LNLGRPELQAAEAGIETDSRRQDRRDLASTEGLGKERNLIGHGVRLWTNEERPLVVWHSKFLEEDDWVGAEFFDWTRFDHFMKRATVLLNTFAHFKLLVVAAAEEQKASG
jgi:hypothetical protein